MSGLKSPGTSSGEVVRNSALSFVACAQHAEESSSQGNRELEQAAAERLVPVGLKALCDAYSRLYPDQMNPLQVTTRLKYWLGGHDPLDYISMYWNPGKPEENIPPHWHYVSFGLSDLHGDGRVHAPPDRVVVGAGGQPPPPSGFGLELTFRLEAPPPPAPAPAAPPPLWPAALLQALARYMFSSGNKLVAGDHVSWHCALDGGGGGAHSPSRLRHLLVAADPQLPPIHTSHGAVSFIQMVGCTGRELRAAQRGSGFDVLKLMAEDPKCGGSWLVTRMRRRVSVRGAGGAGRGGAGGGLALLAGVSAAMRWEPWSPEELPSPQLSSSVERQIKETLQRGLSTMSADRSGPEGHTGMSTDSFEMSSMERALPRVPESMQSVCSGPGGSPAEGVEAVEQIAGVHLVLGAAGARLLPVALRGRVLQGAHFTWRCGPRAATLLHRDVRAALASDRAPYVLRGLWLQMVIPEELAEDMSKQVSNFSALADSDSESDDEREADEQPPSLPLTLTWPKYRLKISVLPDHEVL